MRTRILFPGLYCERELILLGGQRTRYAEHLTQCADGHAQSLLLAVLEALFSSDGQGSALILNGDPCTNVSFPLVGRKIGGTRSI